MFVLLPFAQEGARLNHAVARPRTAETMATGNFTTKKLLETYAKFRKVSISVAKA